ncbi:MAG: hypothetical protein J07HN4v3_00473 [Halonotius sp. J07HN4]|nr:MAG: hypothetical protein J07HN4v3_00473 [Halonotius sp. J07HN4]
MDGSGDMTLAFELEALQSVADPGAVITDARQWTEYVGVVSEKPTYVVTNFTRKHRVRQDFFLGATRRRRKPRKRCRTVRYRAARLCR